MAADWQDVRLGDVAEIVTGYPFKSEFYVEDHEAPRLVRGDNVVQGALRWDGAKRWPRERTEGLQEYWLREGDVVLAMDRPWIDLGLKYASIREVDLPALLVQRVARLRGTARLDTSFLKFVIGSRSFTEHVLAVQTGTAVPHISSGQIRSFEFRLPPLPEQRAIAHVLGTLDDKIELNRRMSETLEAIARTIFKSWFVDFDPVRAKVEGRDSGLPSHIADLFPAGLDQSELGEIPAGWEVMSLDGVATFLNGLALQNYPAGPGLSLPVIKIAQLRKGDSKGADRCTAELPVDYIVSDGDVLFSWSGSLECVLWVGGSGALNQHLFKVTSDRYPKWFCYLWIHEHLADFRGIAAGKATTMGHIQRHHLSQALVVVPSSEALAAADQLIGPLLDSLVGHALQVRTLAALRDALLPKLISGELRLSRAEQVLKEVS